MYDKFRICKLFINFFKKDAREGENVAAVDWFWLYWLRWFSLRYHISICRPVRNSAVTNLVMAALIKLTTKNQRNQRNQKNQRLLFLQRLIFQPIGRVGLAEDVHGNHAILRVGFGKDGYKLVAFGGKENQREHTAEPLPVNLREYG